MLPESAWPLTEWKYKKIYFLPVRASEQGNVIGLVPVYIYNRKTIY